MVYLCTIIATREHSESHGRAGTIPRFYSLPVHYFELCYEIGIVESVPDLESRCLIPVIRWQRHSPDVLRFFQFDTALDRILRIDVDNPTGRSFVGHVNPNGDARSR